MPELKPAGSLRFSHYDQSSALHSVVRESLLAAVRLWLLADGELVAPRSRSQTARISSSVLLALRVVEMQQRVTTQIAR